MPVFACRYKFKKPGRQCKGFKLGLVKMDVSMVSVNEIAVLHNPL